MKFNGKTVARVRSGVGRDGTWFQVKLVGALFYADARRSDLTVESLADAKALDDVTPRKLPDFVELVQEAS
jgi:hypothetical protein